MRLASNPPPVNIIEYFFFFQAEDGIRDHCVTGVQTCALPISPVVFCGPPFAVHPPGALQSFKGWKKRARIDLKHSLADLLNAQPDTMRMHRLKRKGLQDEHVERALNQRRIVVRHAKSPLEDLVEGNNATILLLTLDCQVETHRTKREDIR